MNSFYSVTTTQQRSTQVTTGYSCAS